MGSVSDARSAVGEPSRLIRFATDHVLVVAVIAVYLFPLAWMALQALQPDGQWGGFPTELRWDNFGRAINRLDLPRLLWNTTLIAGLSTLGVVLSCVGPAYAFGVMRWRGRDTVFVLVLLTMVLPSQSTTLFRFSVFAEIGVVGTMLPLVLPSWLGDAFSIFLLRQFFTMVPRSLIDAVRVDGGGEVAVLRLAVLPLALPALAAVTVFHILHVWTDVYEPLIYLSDRSQWTMSLGLLAFQSQRGGDPNLLMAASMLFYLPVLLVFILVQRRVLDGIRTVGKRP
jgi:multiple sugar transport system permease protein